MPTQEEQKSGGQQFVGYKTLFVNSKETQRLAQIYGLPPVAPLKKATEFNTVSPPPPDDLTDAIIMESDLVRYNLGKFFWKNSKIHDNNDYQFIEPKTKLITDSDVMISEEISGETYNSPIKYFIGSDLLDHLPDPYDKLLAANESYTPVVKTKDLQNLKFTSETFIILHLDFNEDASSATQQTLFHLQTVYPDSQNPLLLDNYIKFGKGTEVSPQYLGLALSFHAAMKGVTPLTFLDHAFNFSHPYGLNNRDDLGNIKVLYADIKSEYNFYQERYEQGLGFLKDSEDIEAPNYSTVAGGATTELYLPNFNVILEESKTSEPEGWLDLIDVEYGELAGITNKNYIVHSTLGGRLPTNILRPLETQDKKYDEVNGRSGNEYLDKWSRTIISDLASIKLDTDLRAVTNKFKNIIYPLGALKNDDINISKASFPFYNEINFNTDTTNKMADILKNSKLFDVLILDYINQMNTAGTRTKDIDFHSYQELKLSPGTEIADIEYFNEQTLPFNKNGFKYRSYDFGEFVKEIKSSPLDDSNPLMKSVSAIQPSVISVSGEDFSDESLNLLQANPLLQLIYKMTFLSMYTAFVEENIRTYKDIVEGRLAYNETLFYRIEKRNTDGDIIQNFYVLNDSELNEVNLIDTQIKYGKQYTYQIFAIQFVIGNKYGYVTGPDVAESSVFDNNNPYMYTSETTDGGGGHGGGVGNTTTNYYFQNLLAKTEQSIRLIEIPYVQPGAVRVQEAPPVPPNINFVPYRGIDNQVLITFNTGVDEYYDTYIPILPGEEEIINSTAITNSRGQTLFKSEGDVTKFELFRISELHMPDGPKSYLDFGIPKIAKRVTLNRDFGDPTYIDNIVPNTKYWYTFRTKDAKHSSLDLAPDFSNPTVVYEIQLINNEGAIYLILNTYDVSFFNQQKLILEKQKTRSMRKYLHIQPSFKQTIINTDVVDYFDPAITPSMKKYVEEDKSNNVSDFKLGYTEETIFGNIDDDTNNKFKVRLTSKKTGRKLDIFLRFKKPTLEK